MYDTKQCEYKTREIYLLTRGSVPLLDTGLRGPAAPRIPSKATVALRVGWKCTHIFAGTVRRIWANGHITLSGWVVDGTPTSTILLAAVGCAVVGFVTADPWLTNGRLALQIPWRTRSIITVTT